MSDKVSKLTKTVKRRPKSDSGGNKLDKEQKGKKALEEHQQESNTTEMHTFGEVNAAVPAFLAKLWRLVDDPETNNLICWSKDGRSFIIQNQAQFARDLLPLNYKHNNMASFIRQLNMYGFHKITSIDNGGLKFDRDEMEFSHPCFKRNCLYLLEHIKRKISNTKNVDDKSSVKTEAVSKVLQDVKAMRGRQDSLDSRFSVMKQENEALWREIASLRQKHAKQQQIVNKLIQFLITIVQPSRNMSGVKRHMQLMIHDTPDNSKMRKTSESESEVGNGPVIHELGEELLEEVADTVGSLINPNSPYLAGHYDNDCTSPQTLERPQSAISVGSQSYDYSNQSGEDPFNVVASGAQAGATQTTTGNQTALSQSSSSPAAQQINYHVSEVPDAHPTEVPQSPYNDDSNVLTTPMVREQEARLLKEKNKQRQKALSQVGDEAISSATAPKLLRSSNQVRKQQQEILSKPIQVKTEPDMDPMMFLNTYSDNTFMNVDSNLISPNSQISGEESRQSAGNLNVDLATIVNSANSDLYNANFISNDMPSELFEDTPLLNEDTSDAYKLNQQQQFGRNTVSNGKFASTIPSTSGAGDNALANVDVASTSSAAVVAVPVTDANVPSTSKGVVKSLPQPQEQQFQQQGKDINNLTVAKYNGSGGVVPGGNEDHLRLSTVHEVNDHLDNLQDELETLKDLLRGENYSIDQNMLIGLIGSRRFDAKPGVASFNSTILDYPNFGKQLPMSDADEADLMNKLFNDTDLLDTYGLSFHNDNTNDKNKGSELMTYQPMYDLSDMINDNKNGNTAANANQDGPSSSQLNSPSSVLNTPYHE